MKELRISFKKFKFTKFEKKTSAFAREVMESVYPVAWVKEIGDEPEYDEDRDERDYLSELKEEGKFLYFIFSDVNTGDPIRCVNGKEYEFSDDFGCGLGETDTLGYLLKYSEGELIINSAVNVGASIRAAYIKLEEDCDVFDKPMEKFIKGFIGE